VPEYTVIQAPDFHSNPDTDGTASEVCILVNFAGRCCWWAAATTPARSRKRSSA
jgi:ATP-dependent phosphoenolpyruvate carboxykinase